MTETKHSFQAEVKQLLHLVTHSLYSNKEIFLRELVSNASDAMDKLRFLAISNSGLLEDNSELKIQIDVDKEAKTITLSDNGIGMNAEDVVKHLGTIAHSGTSEFLKKLTGDEAKDSQMIGQFGVGFYSSFIVADKVTVLSRKAGEAADKGVRWQSDGSGEFSVEAINKPSRGTQIILHMKAGEEEFLDDWKVRSVVTKYSDHISFPVEMKEEITVESDEDAEGETSAEAKDEKKEKKKEVAYEYKAVNKAKALWATPKNQIKKEEYEEFYKHISHDFEVPLLWGHNRVEGKTEYVSLLYIPKHAPFDLWNRDTPRGLKLYVKRVFIMDDAEQLLPLYLRFVKGVIDSSDLPLNVSRELLQNNRIIETIRSATAKRVLNMLEKMAKDDKEKYAIFWEQFGQVIKEGPGEDASNKEQIAKLLRFATTASESEKQDVSLDDYISRLKEEQEHIFYITAESYAAAKHSPHLEIFKKKGIEVLLLSDKVDEWLTSHLTEYGGKTFKSVAKGDLDLGKLEDEAEKEEQKKVETEFSDCVERMKKVLGEKVKDVKVTHRLTDSPSCVVSDSYDMGNNIQRMLKAAGQAVPETKPILEVNPEHTISLKLKEINDDNKFSDWTHLLLEQAILAEGGQLDDPAKFVSRMNQLLLEAS